LFVQKARRFGRALLTYISKHSQRFSFEVHLTDHCNLNCISCTHFSPIADKSFLDVKEYERDLQQLSKIAQKYVRKIHLLGGEPLLHENIAEIIDITRFYFLGCKIRVVTNGILLDNMGADFWDSCRKNSAIVSITRYPIDINNEQINKLSRQYGVKVESFVPYQKAVFDKFVLDTQGPQNILSNFSKCPQTPCHHLYKGKIYMCPIVPYIKYFNLYFSKNLEVSKADFVDIYQIEQIDAILEYFKKPIPFCRYCDLKAGCSVSWGISNKDISEWV